MNKELLKWEYEAYRRRTRNQRKLSKRNFVLAATVLALFAAVVALATQEEPSAPEDDILITEEEKPTEAQETPVVVLIEDEPVPVAAPKYYDVPLDHDLQDALREVCEETGVDMELALAVIWKETRYRNVEGDGGKSFGYMQVQPRWHQERMDRLGVTDLMNPRENFMVGCDFLAELTDKHALAYALTYYNSGKATVSQYAEDVMDYMEGLREAK